MRTVASLNRRDWSNDYRSFATAQSLNPLRTTIHYLLFTIYYYLLFTIY
jgi:hypothetical protein